VPPVFLKNFRGHPADGSVWYCATYDYFNLFSLSRLTIPANALNCLRMEQNLIAEPETLTLNGVKIFIQNATTRLFVFLKGTEQAITERYFSFWNHEATSGDLIWLGPEFAYFLVYDKTADKALNKIAWAVIDGAQAELMNSNRKPLNPQVEAIRIAKERLESIAWVAGWLSQSVVDVTLWNFGDSVAAEKGTGNFDDDVIASGLQRNAGSEAESLNQTKLDELEQEQDETDKKTSSIYADK
jgi:hypothetical protein